MARTVTAGGRARVIALVVAGAVAVGAGLIAAAFRALPGLEQDSVALRFKQRGAQPTKDLLVVAIDERTFDDLGRQWPFPRSLHAKAIDRLRAAGARQIAYDVQFTEQTTRAEDLALFDAVSRAGNVTLATTETDARGHANVFGGDALVHQAHASVAAANLPTSFGGTLERVTDSSGGLSTIAMTVARTAGAHPPHSAFTGDGAWIDFRGAPGTIRTVSFSDLLAGHVDPRLIRGRIVVVGAGAPSLQDVHPTPAADHRLMSGPEIQANAIWTALHGAPLRDASWWIAVLSILALGLLPVAIGLRRHPLLVALAAPATAVGWLAAAHVAFDRGTVVLVTYPLIALGVGTIGSVGAAYVAERYAKRQAELLNALLEDLVRERTDELHSTQLEVIERLAHAAESRDEETGVHVQRIGRLAEHLGRAVGMSETDAERLRYASALHDIGKIGIPDSVLTKPGRLSPQEQQVMRRHTTIGAEILSGSRSPIVALAEVIARTHHERWDGSGYPAGLKGEAIPLGGRITAVCDVFDALLSQRRYKAAWSLDAALTELRRERGGHFDPQVLDAFLELVPQLDGDLLAPAASRGPALVTEA